jgi:hypothetical protein
MSFAKPGLHQDVLIAIGALCLLSYLPKAKTPGEHVAHDRLKRVVAALEDFQGPAILFEQKLWDVNESNSEALKTSQEELRVAEVALANDVSAAVQALEELYPRRTHLLQFIALPAENSVLRLRK